MENGNEYSTRSWPLNYNQNKDRTKRGRGWREEGEGEEKRDRGGAKPALVGSHLFCHVILVQITVYKSYIIYYTHTLTQVTSLWKRLCSLRPCLDPLLPDSSTSIFSGFSSSNAFSFSITPERLHTHTQTRAHTQVKNSDIKHCYKIHVTRGQIIFYWSFLITLSVAVLVNSGHKP